MLWYKAWLETRLRFLICLTGLTAISVYDVIRAITEATPPVSPAYYYLALHDATRYLALFWVVAVNLTTMGGLLREKAVGAASFTLALPFSRERHSWVRIGTALLEAIAMIALPWAGVYLTGAFAGRAPSAAQAFVALGYLVGGGLVYIGVAVLASSLVEGEYVAPVTSFGVVALIATQLDAPGLRDYNPLGFMMGSSHFRIHEAMFMGPFPTAQFGVYWALAGLMIAISVWAIHKWEF